MKSKLLYFSLPVFVVVTLAIVSFKSTHKKVDNKIEEQSPNGFTVVELFTSEGCSSCPAAEEAVARLLAKNKPNVFILSYHVDYWDKLGWKDPFSSAAFTQRQNQYASAFNLNSIYTPQAVVNGTTEFVGSDESRLSAAVDKSTSTVPSVNINIDAKRNADLVTVTYGVNSDSNKEQLLNIALVQPEATVAIKRGENGGRTLGHVNIVRSITTFDAVAKGAAAITIPGDINSGALQVIAFTQNRKTLHITAAQQQAL